MRQKSRGMVKIFQKKIRKSRYQPRQAARIVAGAADFRLISLSHGMQRTRVPGPPQSVAKKMEQLSFPTIAWYISVLDSGAVLGKVTASISADYVFTSQE